MIKEGMIYSRHLGLDWSYSIYLPNERNTRKSLPVLYLLHGAYGHHSDFWRNFDLDATMERMRQAGLPSMAIVMPDGFNSYYINGPAFAMEDAIMEDLLGVMERRHNLSNRKEDRMIGGLSMGGYGALRLALRYPRYFHRAYLFSPAIWQEPSTQSSVRSQFHLFGNETQPFLQSIWHSYHPARYLTFYEQEQSPVSFSIFTGDKDEITAVGDILYFAQRLDFYTNVSMKVIADAGHNWDFWQEAINLMFQDMLVNTRDKAKYG